MRELHYLPLLLLLLAGCTGWYGRTTVSELGPPTDIQLTQEWMRYLWFSGSKVLFLPYMGCSTRLSIVDGARELKVDQYEGRVVLPLIQSCPREVHSPLVVSPDERYVATQRGGRWHAFQRTEAGLFPVSTPEDFPADAAGWATLADVEKDPAALLQAPENRGRVASVMELVEGMSSAERREFLSRSVPGPSGEGVPVASWLALFAELEPADQAALRTELGQQYLEQTANTQPGDGNSREVAILVRLLAAIVDPSSSVDLLRRMVRLGHFESPDQRRRVHALLWAEAPAALARAVCDHFTRAAAGPRDQQERTAPMWMLSYLHDPAVDCPAADARAGRLRPCCDADCDWASPLPAPEVVRDAVLGVERLHFPSSTYQRTYRVARGAGLDPAVEQAVDRLQYTVEQEGPPCIGVYEPDIPCVRPPERLHEQACAREAATEWTDEEYTAEVDDANRRIHRVRSSGAIQPPAVTVVRAEDGRSWRCDFKGTAPFYGFKYSTVAWQLDGEEVELEGDLLPVEKTRPGNRLVCHHTTTKIEVPSVRKILAEWRVTGDARTVSSEPMVVPDTP